MKENPQKLKKESSKAVPAFQKEKPQAKPSSIPSPTPTNTTNKPFEAKPATPGFSKQQPQAPSQPSKVFEAFNNQAKMFEDQNKMFEDRLREISDQLKNISQANSDLHHHLNLPQSDSTSKNSTFFTSQHPSSYFNSKSTANLSQLNQFLQSYNTNTDNILHDLYGFKENAKFDITQKDVPNVPSTIKEKSPLNSQDRHRKMTSDSDSSKKDTTVPLFIISRKIKKTEKSDIKINRKKSYPV